ncbi:MAG: histidine phosphatase family protein [Lachnospiraceae bacterium]|nr:histidine phosphatase family protein [Lachnospiraceae bacterium]
MKDEIELIMIRHGMTPGNQEKRYVGTTDESLCQPGRRQLLARANMLSETPDLVITTPMKRCIESCRILYPGVPLMEIPALSERNFGKWEYRNYNELNGDPEYQAWIDSLDTIPFPDGEGRDAYHARIKTGFERALVTAQEMLWQGKPQAPMQKPQAPAQKPQAPMRLALVVHGGTIMALCGMYGPDPSQEFAYQCGNAEGYCCKLIQTAEGIRFTDLKALSPISEESYDHMECADRLSD